MSRRHLGLAALLMTGLVSFGAPTPSQAGFNEWLKSVMNAPGRHADPHDRARERQLQKKMRKAKVVDPLKQLRHQMVSGKTLTEKQLGRLIKNGDELAAYKLAQKIEAGGDPARLDDAMGYYVVAVKGGRDFALAPIIRLLDTGVAADDAKLLARVEKTLAAKAPDHDNARRALIRMYRDGEPFGLKPDAADALLAAAAEAGDARAALDLAYIMLAGVPNPARIESARGYLTIAARAEDLSIRTQAENILRGLEPGQPPILTVASETAQ